VASGRLVALTGGTGFIGRYVGAAFAAAGWRLRLLVRRDPIHPLLADADMELVLGDLSDPAALDRLVAGADAVVHLAGLTKAPDAAGFMAANRDGSARLAAAVARLAPAARSLLVSSLAAREPGLSAYAASKHAGEDAVRAAGDWTVLRPAVVYGPGDREGLALRRLARGALAPMPLAPEPRLAMVHATDLAAAILALCTTAPPGGSFEVCDARPEGYGLGEILALAARLLGRPPPRALPLPDALLLAAGLATDLFGRATGRAQIAGLGKMREVLHRDWRCDPACLVPAGTWAPRIPLEQGMAETARWWREAAP
jgi:nucleoside-diphosphate-sugar epimerase